MFVSQILSPCKPIKLKVASVYPRFTHTTGASWQSLSGQRFLCSEHSHKDYIFQFWPATFLKTDRKVQISVQNIRNGRVCTSDHREFSNVTVSSGVKTESWDPRSGIVTCIVVLTESYTRKEASKIRFRGWSAWARVRSLPSINFTTSSNTSIS